MDVEIEAKLKVDSLDAVEAKLRGLGAEFVAEQRQTDQQFDDADGTMATTDQCVRLRRLEVGDSTRHILTYKGPQQESEVKKRREIEVEVEDDRAMGKILGALGYEPKLVVEKTRSVWRLGGCEVGLDRLDLLGDFVEIEGPDNQQIAAVQESLGLLHLPHITRSYACMIYEKLQAGGGEQGGIS
jgi:adenylate cyclase class 2